MVEDIDIYIKTVAIQSLFFYIWRMFKKWYIIISVAVLSLLGVTSQQQAIVPNQEIVLQFNDVGISADEAKNAISLVKQQLKGIGVQNIKVKELHQGTLKITYYSDSEVSAVKEVLYNHKVLSIDFKLRNQDANPAEFPSDENTGLGYNLDVYEIQNEHDTNKGLNGMQVVGFDSKIDRFFDPNPLLFSKNLDSRITNSTVKVAYAIHRHVGIAIDNTSKSIPEVRAGPICQGIILNQLIKSQNNIKTKSVLKSSF
tara:strand:+ start:1394 stop:2161 length:768 start_codon:yes stop_codon:yes gene_type:complete